MMEKPTSIFQPALRLCLTAFVAVLLLSCKSSTTTQPAAIETIADAVNVTEKLQLKVIGQFDSQIDREDIKGTMGFQLQLLNLFCDTKGYELKLIANEAESIVFESLDKGWVEIALVNNPVSIDQLTRYLEGPDILSVKTQLIYRRGKHRPQSFEDLVGRHIVVNDNHRSRNQYAFLKKHYPKIEFTFSTRSQEDLMQDINKGIIDYSLINSNIFLQKRSRYHRTKVAYDVFYPENINWLVSPTSDEKLVQDIDSFFETIKSNGVFNHIKEKYFGHVNASKPLSSKTFFSRVDRRLPQYQDLIEQIAQEYNIDWRLLASIAYQESHWNPRAKSVTGVRGMMMLTQATAKELGVTNRLDPAASLSGGAKYFLHIHNRLEQTIPEPDRTWFSLAAYNVGLGHLQDAREITEFHGANPNRWADVKKHLPLLAKKEWYQFTRYGKARGKEPVKYVQYIRHFRDLLEWRFPLSEKEQQELLSKKQPPLHKKDNTLNQTLQKAHANRSEGRENT